MTSKLLLACLLVLGIQGLFGAAEFQGAPGVNLAPRIAPARGQRDASIQSSCVLTETEAVLTSAAYTARFSLKKNLTLTSLACAEVARNVLAYPQQTRLFRIKLKNGKIINGSEMELVSVTPVDNGFQATLVQKSVGLTCLFTARVDADELRMGLTVKNTGKKQLGFMVVFPHLDGIVLSTKGTGDYYLFPWTDGVLHAQDICIRSIYGGTDNGMWQMMDLFSPELGGGLYLRCDDAEGINKGICFRKGTKYAPGFKWAVPDENDVPGRVDRTMNFYDNLEEQQGAAFSFDYQMYLRDADGSVTYPDACLGTHAGNWKNAMKRYAAWSNRTWPHRAKPARNINRWNRLAGHDSTTSLVHHYDRWAKRVKGEYPPDERAADIFEFVGWWTQSTKGPWGIELDKVNKDTMGEIGTGLIKMFTNQDPVSNCLRYGYNLGDYDGYNPQWGGLPPLRQMFKNIQSLGYYVTLYFDPMQVCSESEYGANYGEKYVVINKAWTDYFKCPKNPKTPKDAVFEHCMYCMCINDADYVKDVAKKVKKAVKDTGVDGIRLDVCGSAGFICLNDKHNHVFKEPGQNIWTQAQTRAVQQVRAAMDEVNPELTLETEYAQNDHLASYLDGACAYGIGTCLVAIKPLPVNLFKFYFPHCRLYQINPLGQKQFFDFCLFNAEGTLDNVGYSKQYARILKSNVDAFTGDMEPLVETQTEHLYANQFKSRNEDKMVWTLLNYTGKALTDAPALAVDDSGKYRYLDLISLQEYTPVKGVIHVTMKDRQVLCILRKKIN